jgi:hypothetical protein
VHLGPEVTVMIRSTAWLRRASGTHYLADAILRSRAPILPQRRHLTGHSSTRRSTHQWLTLREPLSCRLIGETSAKAARHS